MMRKYAKNKRITLVNNKLIDPGMAIIVIFN